MAQPVGFGVQTLISTVYPNVNFYEHADDDPRFDPDLVKRTYHTYFREIRKHYPLGRIRELSCFTIWMMQTRNRIIRTTVWTHPGFSHAEFYIERHNVTFSEWVPSNEYVVELH